MACLIAGNFLLNIVEAQISPNEDNAVLEGFGMFFNVVFIIELAINMFSTFVREFFSDLWNWFDTIVVGVSLISMLSDSEFLQISPRSIVYCPVYHNLFPLVSRLSRHHPRPSTVSFQPDPKS